MEPSELDGVVHRIIARAERMCMIFNNYNLGIKYRMALFIYKMKIRRGIEQQYVCIGIISRDLRISPPPLSSLHLLFSSNPQDGSLDSPLPNTGQPQLFEFYLVNVSFQFIQLMR